MRLEISIQISRILDIRKSPHSDENIFCLPISKGYIYSFDYIKKAYRGFEGEAKEGIISALCREAIEEFAENELDELSSSEHYIIHLLGSIADEDYEKRLIKII